MKLLFSIPVHKVKSKDPYQDKTEAIMRKASRDMFKYYIKVRIFKQERGTLIHLEAKNYSKREFKLLKAILEEHGYRMPTSTRYSPKHPRHTGEENFDYLYSLEVL